MSKKQLPGKQTNSSVATLPKKSKSKRKISSTRRVKPSNKNRPTLVRTANHEDQLDVSIPSHLENGYSAQPELKLDITVAESESAENGRIAEQVSESDITVTEAPADTVYDRD